MVRAGELWAGCFGARTRPGWRGSLCCQSTFPGEGDERWATGVLASRPQLLPACWERGHQVIGRFGQPLSLSRSWEVEVCRTRFLHFPER